MGEKVYDLYRVTFRHHLYEDIDLYRVSKSGEVERFCGKLMSGKLVWHPSLITHEGLKAFAAYPDGHVKSTLVAKNVRFKNV